MEGKKPYGPRFEIHSAPDLAAHVRRTLTDPDTDYFIHEDLGDGRTAFYNKKTNSFMVFSPDQFVIYADKGDGHAGTVHRSRPGRWGKEWNKEKKDFQERTGQKPDIRKVTDRGWIKQLEKYKSQLARSAQFARNNPPLKFPEKLPAEITDANRADAAKMGIDVEAKEVEARRKAEAKEAARQKAIEDALEKTQGAKAQGKVTKLSGKGAKLTGWGGVLVTGGVATALHVSFSSQRALAAELHAQELFSDDEEDNDTAYQEYIALNEEIEAMMQLENIVAQGWTFLLTNPAVEREAQEMFEYFANSNNLGIDLDPEIYTALGMSILDGISLRAQFANHIRDVIPENKQDLPQELHHLWSAKKALDEAQAQHESLSPYFNLHGRINPYDMSDHNARIIEEHMRAQSEAAEKLENAVQNYNQAFDEVFANPKTAQQVLSRIPQETLMDMIVKTAPYHKEQQNPLIRRIADIESRYDSLPKGRSTHKNHAQELRDAQEALSRNPQVIYDYICRVFCDVENPAPLLQKDHTQAPGMPHIKSARMLDDLESNPDYVTVALAALSGETLSDIEKRDVTAIMTDPETHPAVLALLKERYGETIEEIMENSPDLLPVIPSAPSQQEPVLEITP